MRCRFGVGGSVGGVLFTVPLFTVLLITYSPVISRVDPSPGIAPRGLAFRLITGGRKGGGVRVIPAPSHCIGICSTASSVGLTRNATPSIRMTPPGGRLRMCMAAVGSSNSVAGSTSGSVTMARCASLPTVCTSMFNAAPSNNCKAAA